jgi:uncharacterized protein (TIGR03067 family)
MTALLLGAALAVSAPALKDRPKLAELVGEWVVESLTIEGTAHVLSGEGTVWGFTKDGVWIIRQGGKESSLNRRYTTDPSARPLRVELMPAVRAAVSRRAGIYKVEGDVATLCLAPDREPRPTEFESTKENRCTVYVLRRMKK